MKTAVVLAIVFLLLSCVSLLAFSRLIPWMRDNLTFFDVASEGNLWTWANVAVLVSAANAHLACALFYRERDRSNFQGWLASSVILLALSLDDLVSLHERLENIGKLAGGGTGLLHFAWIIPGAFIAALIAVLFLALIVRLRGWPKFYLAAGVGLFFFGAIVLESISGLIFTHYGPSAAYVLAFHVEEMIEAVGASLMLCGGLSEFLSATDQASARIPALDFKIGTPSQVR